MGYADRRKNNSEELAGLVFTSNNLAIIGLRALYFELAGMMHRFRYLNVGLGLVLALVGVKMLLSEIYPLPVGLSLGVIALLLGGSVLLSWIIPAPREDGEEKAEGGEPAATGSHEGNHPD